jgi:hypothetical protein
MKDRTFPVASFSAECPGQENCDMFLHILMCPYPALPSWTTSYLWKARLLREKRVGCKGFFGKTF